MNSQSASDNELLSNMKTPHENFDSDSDHTPAKWTKRSLPAGSPEQYSQAKVDEELQYDTLIPLKNHPDGLECLSFSVVT